MRQRILALGAILVLLAVLVACGGGAAAPETTAIDVSALPDTVDVTTVNQVKDSPDVFLLDVREPYEYQEAHIPGITLIPMGEIADRLNEIPTDKQVIVTCRTGNRSGQVADFLRQQGYTNIHNMEGGIVAWQQAGFPVE